MTASFFIQIQFFWFSLLLTINFDFFLNYFKFLEYILMFLLQVWDL